MPAFIHILLPSSPPRHLEPLWTRFLFGVCDDMVGLLGLSLDNFFFSLAPLASFPVSPVSFSWAFFFITEDLIAEENRGFSALCIFEWAFVACTQQDPCKSQF